ncbi:hypothetical protein EV198_1789 [Roseivirga ehrenbergii]|nr:hypothetical protein [Roseivirga ehrenbergii]TCL10757.1 hypothetical protein EV198_1789 [Roseivirga ehrenbergii]
MPIWPHYPFVDGIQKKGNESEQGALSIYWNIYIFKFGIEIPLG